jgi:uncharacterized membrane protein
MKLEIRLKTGKSVAGMLMVVVGVSALAIGFSYNYSFGPCPAPVPNGVYQSCDANLLSVATIIAGFIIIGVGTTVLALTKRILRLKQHLCQ